MKDLYEELPKLKVDLNFPKVLVIVLTLLISFVIPAEFIVYNQKQATQNTIATQSGRVAGLSTQKTNSFTLPLINIEVDLNSSNGVLILLGILLIGIAFILIIFLIVDDTKHKTL